MQPALECVVKSIRLIPTLNHINKSRALLQLTARRQDTSSTRTVTMSSGSPTYTADYLTDKLKKSLNAEHVDIEDLSNCGCGMKFDAVLVSEKFEGHPILKRQRLVNEILAEEMKYIHAFTMQTWTPSQWKEKLTKKQNS